MCAERKTSACGLLSHKDVDSVHELVDHAAGIICEFALNQPEWEHKTCEGKVYHVPLMVAERRLPASIRFPTLMETLRLVGGVQHAALHRYCPDRGYPALAPTFYDDEPCLTFWLVLICNGPAYIVSGTDKWQLSTGEVKGTDKAQIHYVTNPSDKDLVVLELSVERPKHFQTNKSSNPRAKYIK